MQVSSRSFDRSRRPSSSRGGVERPHGRLVGIDQTGEDVHEARGVECGQHRAGAELAAEHQHGDAHKGHVEHVAERTHLNGGEEVVQYDAGAVDAARNEVIGVDEEYEAGAHDRAAHEDK